MKVTNVKFAGINKFDGSLKFQDPLSKTVIYVKSYENGDMYIKPMCGKSIEEFARLASRCFDSKSALKGIKKMVFEFNGVVIDVTEDTADVNTIIERYNKIYNTYEKIGVC